MRIAVLGAGTMGQGIAAVMAAASHEVTVVDAVDRIEGCVTAVRDRARRHGGDVTGTIGGTHDLGAAVRGAEVVFEAVPEQLPLKLEVLAGVSENAAPAAIVATNTSSLPLDRLAGALSHPSRFLAAHFFNPAETIPGVEVAGTEQTDPEVTATLVALLRSAGKEPIEVGSCVGFVANRLQLALFREALACVEEGVITAEDLDILVRRTIGVRLPAFGPFAVADMAGLDVYHAIFTVLHEAYGERFEVPPMVSRLVEDGRLGVKSGAGFLNYTADELRELTARRDVLYKRLLEAAS
ncbi:3-hydroxyacyl-CoA dehydrogenase family protein [Kribbella hippodromi]|uniref:3-hydroxyacyl-CoA dehydrogenase family protein n=1 Tax=Kribbella hippodromi TaxID=434347 RepID=A0ABN2CK56_9ACTN